MTAEQHRRPPEPGTGVLQEQDSKFSMHNANTSDGDSEGISVLLYLTELVSNDLER